MSINIKGSRLTHYVNTQGIDVFQDNTINGSKYDILNHLLCYLEARLTHFNLPGLDIVRQSRKQNYSSNSNMV